ncbi:DNA repair protein RecN (Recombination protein N) [Lachnospiraceae bacterium XBB1006]|nr:DNA repair protein RecN (Recombination protein N) [Lachnospiraceae bacterium XBB1006]
MLQSLHVKNLALIEESEVEFAPGLNILTGETGAGKSIIVGSMNLALGEKIPKDMVRNEEKPALVELIFELDNEEQANQLRELEIEPEANQVVLSRRITGGRSVARVNGETVPVSVLKEVASIFIDIYGQHENQTLLNKKKHLVLLDEYAKEALAEDLHCQQELFKKYRDLKKKREESVTDEKARNREIELLQYEINEIEAANLMQGEDETLEERYRMMSGAKKVVGALRACHELLIGEGESASGLIGRATREGQTVQDFSKRGEELYGQLLELEDLVTQTGRDVAGYMEELNFSEEEFYEVQERLDVINHLKDKYGDEIPEIMEQLRMRQERLAELSDYEQFLSRLEKEWEENVSNMQAQCRKLTEIRKKFAAELTFKVTQALIDLNFLDVKFDMQFHTLKEPTAMGIDEPEFVISVNPGEPLKPIDHVASGGELSRIMLAMKSVLAANDKISTLIFDEIDTGISGRTAQMVAEKMNEIGRQTQVISITHLPQIAAMADQHFLIEKTVVDDATISTITRLSEDEEITELARMLGGAVISDAVLLNARDMRTRAKQMKQ